LYVGPGLVLFGAGILALAGSCMGVAVPARSGARGWAIGYCVLLALLIVLLGVIAAEGDFESILGEPAGLRAGDKAQRASPWHAEPPLQADDRTSGKNLLRRFLWFDVHLVAGLASACFALFLVNIADFFSHRRLERNARIFLIFAVVLNLLTIAVGPLQTTSAAALPAVRWVVLGLLVLVCAWLTVLARRVREMVTRGMTA